MPPNTMGCGYLAYSYMLGCGKFTFGYSDNLDMA